MAADVDLGRVVDTLRQEADKLERDAHKSDRPRRPQDLRTAADILERLMDDKTVRRAMRSLPPSLRTTAQIDAYRTVVLGGAS